MRRVSRTTRVAIHCLFERINLDPIVEVLFVDTDNQTR